MDQPVASRASANLKHAELWLESRPFGQVRLWDANSGLCLAQLEGHKGKVQNYSQVLLIQLNSTTS